MVMVSQTGHSSWRSWKLLFSLLFLLPRNISELQVSPVCLFFIFQLKEHGLFPLASVQTDSPVVWTVATSRDQSTSTGGQLHSFLISSCCHTFIQSSSRSDAKVRKPSICGCCNRRFVLQAVILRLLHFFFN